MAESRTKSDGYNNAVDRAVLVSVAVSRSSFKVEPDFIDVVDESKKYLHQQVEEHHFDAESSILHGRIQCRTWLARAEPQSDEDRENWFELAIFALETDFIVAFELPGEHDGESVKTFFNRMAPLACWPYFRSHVANAAAECGIVIPVLPIKKLQFPVKEAGGYIDPAETRHLLPKEGDVS